ncbi:Eukaryotic translation initiation factor 3 subunit D [Homalodisca vitripennis]|nr:Eukaryotic translation initiation factor 3 subunit D [Homalodisca vitripennis]
MSQHGSSSQYAYYHEEDESTFHLVDTTRIQKPPYQRGRFRQNQRNMRGRGGQRGGLRLLFERQNGGRSDVHSLPQSQRRLLTHAQSACSLL